VGCTCTVSIGLSSGMLYRGLSSGMLSRGLLYGGPQGCYLLGCHMECYLGGCTLGFCQRVCKVFRVVIWDVI